MDFFRFKGSKSKESADASKMAEDREKDPHFRVTLREPGGSGIRIDFRPSDLESAKRKLHHGVAEVLSDTRTRHTEPQEEHVSSSDHAEVDFQENRQQSGSHNETTHSIVSPRPAVGQSEPIDDSVVENFLRKINLLKIERLLPGEKRLEDGTLPFRVDALTNLVNFKVAGEDVLTLSAMQSMLQTGLQDLDLSGQKLTHAWVEEQVQSVPLSQLRVLRLRRNVIRQFPATLLEKLPKLSELDLSDNKITDIPATLLKHCPALEHLNLQNNRITVPAFDFRECSLKSLLLGLNNLDYLPTLAPLTGLTELSIFTIHVRAFMHRRDTTMYFEAIAVHLQILRQNGQNLQPFPYNKEAKAEIKSALAPLLRSSASFHYLLSSSFAQLVDEGQYRDLFSTSAGLGGMQHLLAMLQGPEDVALDTCVAISRMVQTEELAKELMEFLAIERLVDVLAQSGSTGLKLYTLHALRAFANAGDTVSTAMLQAGPSASASSRPQQGKNPSRFNAVTRALLSLLKDPDTEFSIQQYVLKLMGDLAFNETNRYNLVSDARVLATVRSLTESISELMSRTLSPSQVFSPVNETVEDTWEAARSADGRVSPSRTLSPGRLKGQEESKIDLGKEAAVVAAARRVLAIMGDTEGLRTAMGLPVQHHRGVRILSVDGGGVKGIASIKMLAELEARAGAPLHSLFDLVVGTSAGGIIASAMGNKHNMQEIERIYRVVSKKAFSKVAERNKDDGSVNGVDKLSGASTTAEPEDNSSWWQKLVQSGSNVKRLMVNGAKYDAQPLMQSLRENLPAFIDRCMIEGALDSSKCKTAIVSTICSQKPIIPYVFRNYQLPPGIRLCYEGSCRHSWADAMRASSAAPYFFEEFSCGGERFQDGAIAANNPSIVALHEALRLWPGRNIDLVLSVGTGKAPTERREIKKSAGGWGLMETFGEFMVESATSSDRVAEVIEVMSPLIPDTSFYRLQVEDARCGVEIDDTRTETILGLEKAAEEYSELNSSLFDEISMLLSDTRETTPDLIRESSLVKLDPPSKLGVGAGLRILAIEAVVASSQSTVAKFGDSMFRLGIPCEVHTFDSQRGSEVQLDSTTLPVIMRRSTARVVYISCDTLKSGGELILAWTSEKVLVPLEDAIALLQHSASHCDSDLSRLASAGKSPSVDSRRSSCVPTLSANEESAMLKTLENSASAVHEESGSIPSVATDLRGVDEASAPLASETRGESEGPISSAGSEPCLQDDSQADNAKQGDSHADNANTANLSMVDKLVGPIRMGTQPSNCDVILPIATRVHDGISGNSGALEKPQSQDGADECKNIANGEDLLVHDSENAGAPPAKEGSKSVQRESPGCSVDNEVSGHGTSQESKDQESAARRRLRFVKILDANRVVDVSPVERWIFHGEDLDSGKLLFEKAKATNIQAWETLFQESHGDAAGLRSKVVVLRCPIPEKTARLVVTSGAEAVVMPASEMDDSERLERDLSLYAALAQGKSPAIAVAECNCGHEDTVFICVH